MNEAAIADAAGMQDNEEEEREGSRDEAAGGKEAGHDMIAGAGGGNDGQEGQIFAIVVDLINVIVVLTLPTWVRSELMEENCNVQNTFIFGSKGIIGYLLFTVGLALDSVGSQLCRSSQL